MLSWSYSSTVVIMRYVHSLSPFLCLCQRGIHSTCQIPSDIYPSSRYQPSYQLHIDQTNCVRLVVFGMDPVRNKNDNNNNDNNDNHGIDKEQRSIITFPTALGFIVFCGGGQRWKHPLDSLPVMYHHWIDTAIHNRQEQSGIVGNHRTFIQ